LTEPGPVRPPPTLFWLYGLVAAGLFSIGVAAGNLFFLGQRSLDLPYQVAVTRCVRAYPGWATDPSELDQLNRCVRGPSAIWGLVVLAGAVLVLAGALALMVVLPLVDRRRSRWRGRPLHIAGAQQRFDALCDHSGLFGRRRPALFVAGPPVRQPFTTALPGRRPIVVLPAALALLHADSRRFDPVVRHELAHVLARDVSWVSAVRGLLWIVVPAVGIAAIPDLLAVQAVTTIPATVFVEAIVLVAAVAVLAAALLRRRELEADRYAAVAGSASALAELFAGAMGRGRHRNVLRRILATHPDPATRIAALPSAVPFPMAPARPDADRAARSDVSQAAAFGFVTVTIMDATFTVTSLLDYPAVGWLAPVVACAVGGLLLGAGLTPSLYRRAVAAHQSGQTVTWWRPLLGVAVGVVIGMFISPVVSVPGQTAFLPLTGQVATTILSVALVAAAGAGAVAICAGLAVLMSAGPAPRALRAMTYVAGAVAAFVAFWPLTSVSSALSDPGFLRTWFVYGLPAERWPLLFAAVPLAVAVILLSRRVSTGADGRSAVMVGVVAFVFAGLVPVLRGHLVRPHTTDLAIHLNQEGAWISALTGLLVLLIVVGRRGARSLPLGIVVACSVTGASGAVHFVDGALTGGTGGLTNLRLSVTTPSVWLVYLVLLATPMLVLIGRTAPADPVPARPTVDRRRAVGSAGLTAAATVAVAALIIGVGLPVGFVPPPPNALAASPTPQSAPPTTGATPASPGRILTDDDAHTVAASAQAALPAYWKPTPPNTPSGDSDAEPASCGPMATDAYIKALESHQRAAGTADFGTDSPLVPASSLFVDVYAYDEPVPMSLFTAADAALAACPRLTTTSPTGVITIDYEGRPAPAFGEQAWRVIEHLSFQSRGTRLTGTASFTIVSVGNHLITVFAVAVVEDLDETIPDRALTATLATLHSLVG
jgi:Zn-dependent protease with chaperone function